MKVILVDFKYKRAWN